MTKYTELLRDPRWQKKRLEIMQRDEFTCQECYDSTSTLNVHHCYYRRDAKPWEYEDSSLVTLCEDCHERESRTLKQEQDLLIRSLARLGWMASDFHSLSTGLHDAPHLADRMMGIKSYAIGKAISSEAMVYHLIKCYVFSKGSAEPDCNQQTSEQSNG